MNWKHIREEEDIRSIAVRSHSIPCFIFKHSTSCPISSIAKMRLEGDWSLAEDQAEVYFLDLLRYRFLSQLIAQDFEVHHESPQLLLIKEGECVYDNSHLDINMAEIEEYFQQQTQTE